MATSGENYWPPTGRTSWPLTREIFGQVVALFWSLVRFDRTDPVIESGVVLIVLASDESVEVLETSAAGRPGIERANW